MSHRSLNQLAIGYVAPFSSTALGVRCTASAKCRLFIALLSAGLCVAAYFLGHSLARNQWCTRSVPGQAQVAEYVVRPGSFMVRGLSYPCCTAYVKTTVCTLEVFSFCTTCAAAEKESGNWPVNATVPVWTRPEKPGVCTADSSTCSPWHYVLLAVLGLIILLAVLGLSILTILLTRGTLRTGSRRYHLHNLDQIEKTAAPQVEISAPPRVGLSAPPQVEPPALSPL